MHLTTDALDITPQLPELPRYPILKTLMIPFRPILRVGVIVPSSPRAGHVQSSGMAEAVLSGT